MEPLNVYEEIKRLPLTAVIALVCAESEPSDPALALFPCWEEPEYPTEMPLAA
jgi:hypothetical protein